MFPSVIESVREKGAHSTLCTIDVQFFLSVRNGIVTQFID